jgi:hypothetical protein
MKVSGDAPVAAALFPRAAKLILTPSGCRCGESIMGTERVPEIVINFLGFKLTVRGTVAVKALSKPLWFLLIAIALANLDDSRRTTWVVFGWIPRPYSLAKLQS